MKKTYTTREVSVLTGTPWYSVHRYARSGFLPGAKRIPAGKLMRWVFDDRDIKILSSIRFYRSNGYELQTAVELATKIKTIGE